MTWPVEAGRLYDPGHDPDLTGVPAAAYGDIESVERSGPEAPDIAHRSSARRALLRTRVVLDRGVG